MCLVLDISPTCMIYLGVLGKTQRRIKEKARVSGDIIIIFLLQFSSLYFILFKEAMEMKRKKSME